MALLSTMCSYAESPLPSLFSPFKYSPHMHKTCAGMGMLPLSMHNVLRADYSLSLY